MPSSLTRDHSSALGYSPYLPVSVYGTVTTTARYEAFLGSMGSASLRDKISPHRFSELNEISDFPKISPYRLEPGRPTPGWPTLLRPPFAQTLLQWYRNINLFPIAYACRPRLRDRLTLRRLALLRKPWVFGEPVSHRLYRYLCQHNLFHFVHRSLRSGFDLTWNAPLPLPPCGVSPRFRLHA